MAFRFRSLLTLRNLQNLKVSYRSLSTQSRRSGCFSRVWLLSAAAMTTDSRLTRGQLASSQRERYLNMPINEKRGHYRCGSDYLTLDKISTWSEYCKAGNLGQAKQTKFPANNDFNEKLSVWRGDITTLEIDGIVNAANKTLMGGGGVDGAIHRAAGPELKTESGALAPCETGEAKLTGGYRLPAKYVIHTVGPIGEKPDLLQKCYRNCLDTAKDNGIRTIAFPCISTGVYDYPSEAAAVVALETVRDWLQTGDNAKKIDRIIFVIFDPASLLIYEKRLKEYFPVN